MHAIQVEGLRKSYGRHEALAGIDFTVDRGEVVGLLGPNGAGKTTAMRLLAGYLSPTAGRALVGGVDVLLHPTAARRRLGYLPESAPVYTDMRVDSYLDFVGRVRGMGRSERAAATERTMARTGLTERRRQSISTLSKGFRQRVGLAQALLHQPQVLVLDEPTAGLDPNQIQDIRALIRELGRRHALLLSTHILSEVQATCDRVIIVHAGRIVADGPTAQVTSAHVGPLLRASFGPGEVACDAGRLLAAVSGIPGVRSTRVVTGAEQAGPEVALEVAAERDLREALFRLAVRQGLVLLELYRVRSNLEEVFRRLTVGDGGSDQPGGGRDHDDDHHQPADHPSR